MIKVNGLSKEYKIVQRSTAPLASLRSLFYRKYDIVKALQDVSFSIEDGEVVGYIGPNGAGKSTTIKILCGILRPDSGTCVINDRIPWLERKEHVRNIGVVFGQRTQLWWDVPVLDSFALLRDIYSVPHEQYRKTLSTLTDALDIGSLLGTPLRQLSLGQRMRCEIAGSLLHSPRLLFLDEPTIGLDAISKLAVRAFIKTLQKEQHTTVLLTTHDMNDIEALTDRILLIGKGQLLHDGSLSAIKSRYDTSRTLTALFAPHEEIVALPDATLVSWETERAVWQLPAEHIPQAMAYLSRHLVLRDITSQGIGVEEIIAKLYREYQI